MFGARDALILATTTVACIASIASDTEVSGSDGLDDITLTQSAVFALQVTLGAPSGINSFSSIDSTFGASVSVETDADGAAVLELENITATLFEVGELGRRGEALDVGLGRAVFTEDDVVFSSSVSTETRIDCKSAPCIRAFELELTPPDGFVGIADLRASAFNHASSAITVEIEQLD